MGRTSRNDEGKEFLNSFKRAASPMLVLLLLNEKPMYVYKLSQELERRSDSTFKLNFLYPVLYRLQQDEYVVEYSQEITESHRTRNYYAITDKGRDRLQEMIRQYNSLIATVNSVIENDGSISTELPTLTGYEEEDEC